MLLSDFKQVFQDHYAQRFLSLSFEVPHLLSSRLYSPMFSGSKDSASHVFNFFQIFHQYSTKLCKFFESGKLCHLWKFVFGDMIFRLKNHWILSAFFNCYLAAPQPTLGHYQGGSLTHPMLITCILHIWPEGQQESHSEVGSLSPSEHLVGFEPGTLRFWIFDNSFQIYPTWKLIMGESYKTLL